MIYMLMPPYGTEVKNTIDAESKDATVKYFASLMHMELEILLQLYIIKRKSKDKWKINRIDFIYIDDVCNFQ